jgi:hypothetical protein
MKRFSEHSFGASVLFVIHQKCALHGIRRENEYLGRCGGKRFQLLKNFRIPLWKGFLLDIACF